MAPTSEVWDFFLSFASPERARAGQLAELLEAEGWRVFLADRSIEPGATWDERLSAALKGSRVVAVLLSNPSATAHYQREEIHLAIELARGSELEVVPVYLDGMPAKPADWEFGLRRFQWIDWRRAGPDGTAGKLGALLADRQAGVGAGRQREEWRTVGELLHGAALRIDRTRQWLPLVEVCATGDSALFLLHGPRRQNLDLFVSRIWHYLAQECGSHHRPYVVPLRVEFAKPRSAAAWENHLRIGLAGEGRGGGTAEDLLREAARAHPVFLVLSRLPIGSGELEEAELEALEEFLDDRLPGLIAGAAAGRHPIRALLATHYESAGESLVERLDEKASEIFLDRVIDVFEALRAVPALTKKPATSELINWVQSLRALHEPAAVRRALDRFAGGELPAARATARRWSELPWRDLPAPGCLVKLREDLARLYGGL